MVELLDRLNAAENAFKVATDAFEQSTLEHEYMAQKEKFETACEKHLPVETYACHAMP